MPSRRHILIANPDTKRCELYARTYARLRPDDELIVVPWLVVARAGGNLDGLPAFDRPARVRLESPGKNADVTRVLCGDGGEADLPKGLLHRPGRWYEGFRRVLHGLRRSFDDRPYLKPTACPLAIADMFDKNRTLERLRSAELPVPEWLPPVERYRSAAELIHILRDRRWRWSYVKLNTGSSAVGIVALQIGRNLSGITTMLMRDRKMFNTRRPRTVTSVELCDCLEFLEKEGATVQRAVPHAQMDGMNADLRVVCVRGGPVATIFRLSPHPMTNLHLGGRRGDWSACRAAIPNRYWLDALDHSAEAARLYSATAVGVDLVFAPGFARHAILEVNAFGDFFPGWRDGAGRALHELVIAADSHD